jgi:hypothetical protein
MSDSLLKCRIILLVLFKLNLEIILHISLLSSVFLFYVVYSVNCNSLYVLITLVILEFIKLQYQNNISEKLRNMIRCSVHVESLLFGRSEGFSLAEYLDESLVS